MVPYFVMVGLPAVMALFFKLIRYNKEKANRIVIDLFFIIWIFLLLFRDESVGTDLHNYKLYFININTLSWVDIFERFISGNIEIGYLLLAKIIFIFSSDFRWVIIFSALISVVPIWNFYRNNSNSSYLSMIMFLNIAPFSMYFSGLRQAMAMAFVVPCYIFCKENKLLKFFLTVLFAALFHKSALVLLLMYPVYHLRLKRQYHIIYLLPIIGIIYVYKLPIFSVLILFLGSYTNEYIDSIRITGAYAVTVLLIALLVYSFFMVEYNKLDDEVVGLRNLLVLSVVLQVFSGVHSIAMRMNYYYLLFIPILIPRIIHHGSHKSKTILQLSVLCMLGFFTIYYFYYAYTDVDILNVYPYVSLFQNLY